MDLAKSLRKAMAEKNIKGKELAEMIDVPPSTISRWRHNGDIGPSKLLFVSGALGLRVSDFVALGESE